MADKSVLVAEPGVDTLALEQKFDPEVHFRPQQPMTGAIVASLLFALSCFHYYTAGFGLLREVTHRGIHLAFVVGLIFLVFAATHARQSVIQESRWWRPGGIHLIDWLLALAAVCATLYVPYIFVDLAFRVG